MLDLVKETINDNNLAEPSEILSTTIHFSNERMLNVSALLPGGRFFYIRAINTDLLPSNEGARYRDALKNYPKFIPPILAHTHKENWEIIIIRGVKHQRVTPEDLFKNKQKIVEKIISFVENSVTAIVESPNISHQGFLEDLISRTNDSKCLSILRLWQSAKQLDALPHIPQHGDFTTNNFGLLKSGLVIFDWEDFGKVYLPGFDIFILIASSFGFRTELIKNLLNNGLDDTSCFAHKLVQSCAKIGITSELFKKLTPLYLVIFLDLKKNYSPYIYELVKSSIYDIT